MLPGGVPSVAPGHVVIIGAGVVGTNALQMAVGIGARVTVLDKNVDRLRQLDLVYGNRIATLYSNAQSVEESVLSADVVIGGVLIPGAAAPKLVTRSMISRMKQGAVVVDVAIDQGGCFENSYATTHAEPTYLVDGVVHYCVANMPGAVARTSTFALNNATIGYAIALADKGWKQVLKDSELMAMWEMGLRTLKVPEQDMRNANTVARAQLMSDVGHDFIITTLGVPGEAFISDVVASQVNVSAIELNLPMEKFIHRSSVIARLRKLIPAKIILSKLRTTEDSHFDGQHFSHFVHAGIRIDELPSYRDQLAALVRDGIIDGITVRLDRGTDIVAAAARLEQFSKEIDCDIIASVKLAGDNLARASDDDFDTARLAAEAFIASKSSRRVRYVFDTFMDVDRGYFPRNGFIDRRFDPRAAAVAVASLVASERSFLCISPDVNLNYLRNRMNLKSAEFSLVFGCCGLPLVILDPLFGELV